MDTLSCRVGSFGPTTLQRSKSLRGRHSPREFERWNERGGFGPHYFGGRNPYTDSIENDKSIDGMPSIFGHNYSGGLDAYADGVQVDKSERWNAVLEGGGFGPMIFRRSQILTRTA